jgi:IS605 OrfB family transposase
LKFIRSSKCSVQFATQFKQEKIKTVLTEYGKVVNFFIDYLSVHQKIKAELLKPIVDLPETWLSYRLRLVAAREAIDMFRSVQEGFEWNKQQVQNRIDLLEKKINKTKDDTKKNRSKKNTWYNEVKAKKNKLSMMRPHKPKHSGKRMCVSSNTAELEESKNTKEFNAWLHIASIGNKIIIDLPIKFHRHFNILNSVGRRCNYYIITEDYVQFFFEITTNKKKEVTKLLAGDTGINALLSQSDGKQLGTDMKECVDRSKRCKPGSKGRLRAKRALKQRMDEVAKEFVVGSKPDLVVVEKLSNLNESSKLKGRLSQNMRSVIGNWNYAYFLNRVEQQCERNRVSFRTVAPYNTSITCPICGCIDKTNRVGEIFKCQRCNHTDNADINAAKNILNRFVTGKYGSCYKHLIKENP